MLDGGGDDVPALGLVGVGRAAHRPVVRLGAAAGEVDLVGLGVQRRGDLTAGLFHGLAGFAAEAVNRHGVAEDFTEIGAHGLHDGFRDAGGRGVVHINSFHGFIPPAPAGADIRRSCP